MIAGIELNRAEIEITIYALETAIADAIDFDKAHAEKVTALLNRFKALRTKVDIWTR